MKKGEESKVCIRFVEEDEYGRANVSLKLAALGYETKLASTMKDALRLAEKRECDLILLDWYYADGTGIELCKKIRSFDTQTPILFYTGVALEANIAKAREAGAQGIINKPIDENEVKGAVEKYAKKRRAASDKLKR